MVDRFIPGSGISRRGLLLGGGLIAAPFVIRSRPESIEPVALPPDRVYPRGDLLIAPQALHQRLIVDRLPIRLLDATALATFRDSHIPGAVHVWWQDTMELNDVHYGKVLKPDDGDRDQGRRVRLLERLGIDPAGEVVVYGDTLDMPAARVCWFLRFLGIKAAILDGGRAAWLGIDGPLTDETVDITGTSIETVGPRLGFYVSVTEAAEHLADPVTRLIDLRESYEHVDGPYRGLEVPGAVRIPRSAFLDGRGTVPGAADLEQILAAAGVDVAADLILLGPTGLDAAIPWLALSLLGAESVVIVDGGWGEWVNTPGLPLSATALTGPKFSRRTA